MSKTYILVPNHKPVCGTAIVDIVTEMWESTRKWVVGERRQDTGVATFYGREYRTFTDACDSQDVAPKDARKRAIPSRRT